MSPWVQARVEAAHVCAPPRRWLSRRRHPDGSVWECDEFVPFGQGADGSINVCRRRWVLWWDPGPVWTRERAKPAASPPGCSGVSASPDGAR